MIFMPLFVDPIVTPFGPSELRLLLLPPIIFPAKPDSKGGSWNLYAADYFRIDC